MIHIERGKIDTFQVGDFSDITRVERNSLTFFFEIENKSPRCGVSVWLVPIIKNSV